LFDTLAQVAELNEALNRISNECNRLNRSLVMIAREARKHKVPQNSPDNKKGLEAICIYPFVITTNDGAPKEI
jgi:hypothetical protein